MSNELKTEIDLRGLNKLNAQLLAVLIGTGQGGEGDAQRFIRTEAGQLAWEISKQLGPKTLAQGNKKITADVKKVFFPLTIPMSSVFKGTRQGQGDIQWLFGSKTKNYLVGADREDVQLGLNSTSLAAIRRTERRDRGARWRDISGGNRASGQQRTMKLERTVVRASSLNAYIKALAQKVGVLRASFAYNAALFVPSKPIPQWIKKHFSTRANGKTILTAQLKGDCPNITFGSRSPGVVSNPYITDKIARAVQRRQHVMAKKIKDIVKGYTYNWNTGQTFRKQVPKEGIE